MAQFYLVLQPVEHCTSRLRGGERIGLNHKSLFQGRGSEHKIKVIYMKEMMTVILRINV